MNKTVKIILVAVLLAIVAFAADAFIFMNHMKSESLRVKSVERGELEKLCETAMAAPAGAAEVKKFMDMHKAAPPGTEYDFPIVAVRRHHVWAYKVTLPCKVKVRVTQPAAPAQ
ncbi:MAG: hypothetical protein WBK55_03370 [Alphaproteobacteria bacterium]